MSRKIPQKRKGLKAVDTAEGFFGRQKRDRGGATCHVFHNGVGGTKFETIRPMPMQAGRVNRARPDCRRSLLGNKIPLGMLFRVFGSSAP
jgi:hypothetical protein